MARDLVNEPSNVLTTTEFAARLEGLEALGVKVEVLEEMLEYAAKSSQQEQSFTVQWTQRGSGELHTSYFRAHTMYEVLDKFFHGREKHEYVLFSITMNPIA